MNKEKKEKAKSRMLLHHYILQKLLDETKSAAKLIFSRQEYF